MDPIAADFAHVSGYNYAENEPVGHIDLWGLQKETAKHDVVYYKERSAFMQYPDIKNSTTPNRNGHTFDVGYFSSARTTQYGEATNLGELVHESLKGKNVVYLK